MVRPQSLFKTYANCTVYILAGWFILWLEGSIVVWDGDCFSLVVCGSYAVA